MGGGAIAQGTRAKAAGKRGVVADQIEGVTVTGDNNSITYIVKQYRSAGESSLDEGTLHRQIAGYLTWMRERFGTIELRGIKREGQQVVQLDLETVYVPLEASVLGWAHSISLNQVLAQGTRLIVTGGPGCGKTTVLQHIAWTLASAIATDKPELAHDQLGLPEPQPTKDQKAPQDTLPLPIFISLGAYAQYRRQLPPKTDPRERTLAAFISRYLIERQTGLDLPEDFFARLLGNGQAVILLLDGLDEVPNESERVGVRQAIEDLVTGRETMRVVVTCRTAAYEDRTALGKGFREVRVQPLEDEDIAALVSQAYTAIYRHDPTARQNKATELLQGIRNLEEERRRRLGKEAERLVASPLLVRMLLVVHFSERRLPEQRAALYMKTTDAMLLPEYAPDEEVAEQIGRLVGGSREIQRELVQHLAFAMHRRGPTQGREIGEDDLRRVLGEVPTFTPLADDFIALTRLRGTLLEEHMATYRFIHLSFQEYLAARYLAEVTRSVEQIVSFLEDGPILDSWWREPALLVAGYLSLTSPHTGRLFLRRLAGIDEGAARRHYLSADTHIVAAEVAGTACMEWQTQDTELRQALAARIVALFQDTEIMSTTRRVVRVAAGDTLARLGDPRIILDKMEFCLVPAGPFWMGSEEYGDERPVHQVNILYDYWITRYPVTVAQFRAFVESSGHQLKDATSLEGGANHPVVDVTWHEAVAFTRWLTERWQKEGRLPQGWEVRLPSEAEWEKAARGGMEIPTKPVSKSGRLVTVNLKAQTHTNPNPQRRYPWGDKSDPNRANYDATGIGNTSAVGCFPGGQSPYNAQDMSGNVWEWCQSLYQPYPYRADDGRENLEAKGLRAVRGGSFYFGQRNMRCAYRLRSDPDFLSMDYGFRLVVSPL
jgi:formylglycine-generating enzyme required for sulfatase activity